MPGELTSCSGEHQWWACSSRPWGSQCLFTRQACVEAIPCPARGKSELAWALRSTGRWRGQGLTSGSVRRYHLAELLWKTVTDSTTEEKARSPAGSTSELRDTLEKSWVAGL